ncbi:MAG: cysteine synthase A [Pseudomonadales bacterium]|nr:cysteine synthase A [Pseudomonadales bacterium]
MTKVFEDNSLSIGKTPLVKINRITSGKVFAKIESRNPANSVKCRIGANMIWAGEKQGRLKPGMQIVEPTSGNTGIALAFVAASRGYSITLTMPETMSIERRQIMAALGANVVLTEGAKGMPGAIARAEEICAKDPDNTFMPGQFDNPANPEIHELTTGPEIWEDTAGDIDVLVSGVGTGGTISGISRFIKKTKGKAITAVAIEPASSTVIASALNGVELTHGPHKIQGIGAGFLPKNLDLSLIDRVEQVSNEDAMTWAHKLMKEEGILAGISSGAAMCVADRIASQPAFSGKTVVVILPDSAERYLSSALFEG